MGWIDGPRLALDTETTGKDPTQAHLVTACLMRIEGNGEVSMLRNWIADPGIEIPDEAAAVHGVTTERARAEGAPEAEVLTDIDAELTQWCPEVPLVIYNAPYDLTLISTRMRAREVADGLPILGPVLDGLAIDRGINRYRKGGRKLGTMCAHYGVALSEADAHSADADCRAAHELVWAMAKRHGELRRATLRELYVLQRRSHRAWAENFQGWLRSQPRREDETEDELAARRVVEISTDWPMNATAIGVRRQEAS